MHIKNSYSNNSTFYKGELQKIKDIEFNFQQELLLNRAVYGLDIYSKTQLNKMHWRKKDRILKVNTRTKTIIELYKQKKIKELCSTLITNLFPNSKLSDKFLNHDYKYDEIAETTLSLNTLKIKQEEIIDLLFKERILPSNFYTL